MPPPLSICESGGVLSTRVGILIGLGFSFSDWQWIYLIRRNNTDGDAPFGSALLIRTAKGSLSGYMKRTVATSIGFSLFSIPGINSLHISFQFRNLFL